MNLWGAGRRRRWIASVIAAGLCVLLAGPAMAIVGEAAFGPKSELSDAALVALEASSPIAITKNVQRTVLENGLTVLTKEVHTAPVVSVQVWYKIGSRNEAPGVNGIAHQLEHMLFKGTKTRPVQFGRLLSALGSDFNAFTSYDQTVYHETLERNKLKSALILESDRMQNALIDTKLLEGEKRVVISELQGNENSPQYRLGKAVQELALPDSPYGLSVGGTKADVQTFTEAQVRSYYDSYYAPNNAVVVLVGDFNTASALQDVRDTFGKAPRRPVTVTTPKATPRVVKSRRITLREPGSNPLLNAVYPLPAASDPDVPALDVMNYILSVGRSSRLYQKLIEPGLATGVDAGAVNLAAGGWYEYSAAIENGKSLEEIDNIIQAEIGKMQQRRATKSEIDRAKTQLRAGYLLAYRDINSQGRQLGNDETTVGDFRFTDKYLAKVATVTASDVQRVAAQYLKPSKRILGFFEPDNSQGQPAQAGGAHSATANLGPPLDAAELKKYLPEVTVDRATNNQNLPELKELANGLRILLLPDSSSPTITLGGHVTAGTEFDRPQAGVASLTASNLMSGTRSKNALTLAKTLENRGASLGFGASREGVAIGGSALDRDLPILLSTLGDVLQNANFPAKEFGTSRQRALAALQAELENPSSVARRKFQQTVYPLGHPFTNFTTLESLKAIDRSDLESFYIQHYRPRNTVLALVGNFEPSKAMALFERQFGSWDRPMKALITLPLPAYPEPVLPTQRMNFNPTIVGKTQSITIMGNKAIDRKDPRYYASLVLNQVLGGDTLSSRLGTEIRDRQGLTYGIYSSFVTGKRQGTFIVSMQTAPGDASRAVDSTIQLIQQIKDQGLTAAEVENAKQSIASNYTVELAAPDDVASTSLSNLIYNLSATEIRDFPTKIRAVTLDQVNQAAKELLHPDKFIVVTAGPPLQAAPASAPSSAPTTSPTTSPAPKAQEPKEEPSVTLD
jgi:zinc protease